MPKAEERVYMHCSNLIDGDWIDGAAAEQGTHARDFFAVTKTAYVSA